MVGRLGPILQQQRRFTADGGLDEAVLDIVVEQGFHLLAQLRVPGAGFIEKLGALAGLPFYRRLEDLVDAAPAVGIHGSADAILPPAISRRSQASALRSSRPTVATEIPRASTVSCTLRPPK